jgi:hypothetical protein
MHGTMVDESSASVSEGASASEGDSAAASPDGKRPASGAGPLRSPPEPAASRSDEA